MIRVFIQKEHTKTKVKFNDKKLKSVSVCVHDCVCV